MRASLMALALGCVSLCACSTQSWLNFAYTQTTQFCGTAHDSEARRRCIDTLGATVERSIAVW